MEETVDFEFCQLPDFPLKLVRPIPQSCGFLGPICDPSFSAMVRPRDIKALQIVRIAESPVGDTLCDVWVDREQI